LFWGFVAYTKFEIDVTGGLELEFGGIHCGFGGVIATAPTSFEQCHTFSS